MHKPLKRLLIQRIPHTARVARVLVAPLNKKKNDKIRKKMSKINKNKKHENSLYRKKLKYASIKALEYEIRFAKYACFQKNNKTCH